ncbi:MAG: acyltransferase [Proteobacteria bacterium]|nr:acyltransferase [Pseudomonadota bacterium]
MFRNVQGLRGIAAMMVMLIHLLSTRDGMGADWLKYRYWWVGPAGVDIFFVISGFIVTIAALRAAASSGAVAFGVRRILRIYPLYWCVLAVAVPASGVFVLAPAWLPQADPWQLLFALTSNNDKVLAAWTLCYEMFFYAVLTALIALAPKHLFRAVALWLAAETVLIALARSRVPALHDWPIASPLVLEFGLGCAVAWLVQRGAHAYGAAALALGLLGFAGGAAVNAWFGGWDHLWRLACLGIPSALIVYGSVGVERTSGRVMPAWIRRFGDASYSLYLWHQLVFAALAWATGALHGYDHVPHRLLLVAWLAIAIGVGFASHRLIEAPTLRFAHRLFAARSTLQGAAARTAERA